MAHARGRLRDELEPTPAALRAIEAEWPAIAADLAEVDAEIAEASAPTPLTARRAAFVEDVEWMADTGETLTGAAARLAMSPATLRRALARADRADLAVTLTSNAVTGSGVRWGRIGGAA